MPEFVLPDSSSSNRFEFTYRRVLWLVVLAGAAIRVFLATGRAYRGDEPGTVVLIDQGYGYLMSHFGGHLTMNLFLILEKAIASVLGEGPFQLGIVSLLAAVGSIPLTAAVGRRLAGPTVALTAAILVAANPFLIWFSSTARVYSLTCFLVLLQWYAALVWMERPSRRSRIGVASASLALCAVHLLGAYHVASVWLVIGVEALMPGGPGAGARGERVREAIRLGVWYLPVAALLIALYGPLWDQILQFRSDWSAAPPTSLAYVPYVLRRFFARPPYLAVSLAAIAAGVVALAVARRRTLGCLLAWVAVPPLIGSLTGISHHPWAHARFLIGIVPGVLLLSAAGVALLGSSRLGRWRRAAVPVALAIMIASWLPTFARDIGQREQRWHEAAAWIRAQQKPEDLVLVLGTMGTTPLTPYFKDQPERLADTRELAEAMARGLGPLTHLYVVSLPPAPNLVAEDHIFGDVAVWVLPAGDGHPWLDPLWQGLLDATETDSPRVFGLHWSLMHLARIRGDPVAEEHHRSLYRSTLSHSRWGRQAEPRSTDPAGGD